MLFILSHLVGEARVRGDLFQGANKMLSLGSLLRIISPLLFQGFELYKNRKDNRAIRDLEEKVKALRILVGCLTLIIVSMLAWILWHLRS